MNEKSHGSYVAPSLTSEQRAKLVTRNVAMVFMLICFGLGAVFGSVFLAGIWQ